MPRKAEPRLGRALAALKRGLDAARVSWMVIGGIAVIAQGVRRTTTDIDVALLGDDVDLERLMLRLAKHGVVSRIDDALAFAERSQVLLLEHAPTGVELDLSLAGLGFEREALGACSKIDFAGTIAPFARPEDLVIYKLFAGRPHDLKDAETLLLLHRREIDLKRVRRVLEELGEAADAPDVLSRLDAIAKRPRRGR